MARKYPSNITVSPYNVGTAQPLDVRTVVEYISDLLPASLLKTTYIGMVVYVLEDSSLYVCYKKPARATQSLTNVEDGWRKLDSDYSVRIVETKENLTDGSILFPYKGMVAYVKSESSLYILLTTGADNAKDINNWNNITSNSSSNSIDKVGIDTDPEGGSGFKITENKDVIIEDYINAYNYIKANYYYTSQGLNSYDQDPNFTYSFVKLTKGGDSFIKLYSNSTKWMEIYDSNNAFGFTIKHKGEAPYVDPDDGTITIYKGTSISFGVDIKFTEGWEISYDDIESRSFVESDYELIDIYRSSYAPEVYAYYNGLDVKVLTENDTNTIANSIVIDIDGSDGSEYEAQPLQVILGELSSKLNKDIENLKSHTSNAVSTFDEIDNRLAELESKEYISNDDIDDLFN